MRTAKKRIDIIREKCDANGLKIHTVFRVAGIPASTIANWDKKEPQAFEVEKKINETIDQLIRDNSDEYIPTPEKVITENITSRRR